MGCWAGSHLPADIANSLKYSKKCGLVKKSVNGAIKETIVTLGQLALIKKTLKMKPDLAIISKLAARLFLILKLFSVSAGRGGRLKDKI